jgi:hypothetical protein
VRPGRAEIAARIKQKRAIVLKVSRFTNNPIMSAKIAAKLRAIGKWTRSG